MCLYYDGYSYLTKADCPKHLNASRIWVSWTSDMNTNSVVTDEWHVVSEFPLIFVESVAFSLSSILFFYVLLSFCCPFSVYTFPKNHPVPSISVDIFQHFLFSDLVASCPSKHFLIFFFLLHWMCLHHEPESYFIFFSLLWTSGSPGHPSSLLWMLGSRSSFLSVSSLQNTQPLAFFSSFFLL